MYKGIGETSWSTNTFHIFIINAILFLFNSFGFFLYATDKGSFNDEYLFFMWTFEESKFWVKLGVNFIHMQTQGFHCLEREIRKQFNEKILASILLAEKIV